MSKLNRAPRVFSIRQTMVTVIHPNFNRSRDGDPRLSDYVDVPRLSTHGDWPMAYMLPDDQLVHLAVLAEHLPAQRREQRKPSRFGGWL